MLLPGSREIHFYKEKESRRRALADEIARFPVEVTMYACGRRGSDEPARQACLARITADLLKRGAHRMVLDSRNTRDGNDRDAFDRRTIRSQLGNWPSASQLVYEHVPSTSEECLWIADAVAWCWGQAGHWRQRVAPIVAGQVVLDGQSSAKPGRPPSGG
jgi:hypothetical protein